MVSGHVMATVPADTTARPNVIPADPTVKDDQPRDALVFPKGQRLHKIGDEPEKPHLHVSPKKELGVFFIAVLLMVIVITNIPLRGLWSVIVLILIALIVVLFAFFEVWNTILNWISILDIRITAGGYFVISIVLFVLWLMVMLVFDRQIYMIFTPGQVRVVQEIGDAETSYDTSGITVQKQRSDLFRHWILGLGSGDLIVKTSGANAQEIHMPNVLFIGRKVAEIEQMLRERPVVMGRPN